MKIVQPDEFERHIILYCKNWYSRTDLITDIRTIITKVSGSQLQYIYPNHAYKKLVDIAVNYCSKPQLQYYIKHLFDYADKDTVTMEEMCNKLAEFIFDIPVNTDQIFIDLGEPDESILPLQNLG